MFWETGGKMTKNNHSKSVYLWETRIMKNKTIVILALLLLMGHIVTVTAAGASEKKKTFADRIDDLEAQQHAQHEASKQVTSRLGTLEGKLLALEKQPGSPVNEAVIKTQVSNLENRIQIQVTTFQAKIKVLEEQVKLSSTKLLALEEKSDTPANEAVIKTQVSSLENRIQTQVTTFQAKIKALEEQVKLSSTKLLALENKSDTPVNEAVIKTQVSNLENGIQSQITTLQEKIKVLGEQTESSSTKLLALEKKSDTPVNEAVIKTQVSNLENRIQTQVTTLQEKIKVLGEQAESSSTEQSIIAQHLTNTPLEQPQPQPHLLEATTTVVAESVESTTSGPDISAEVTADYVGKYIWRGQNLTDGPVVQPGVSVTVDKLTLGIWGNLETTNVNIESGEFTEFDFYLDYSGDVGFIEGLSYSLGLINYQFPSAADTTEFYAGLALDVPLSPSVTVYQDVDAVDGTYVSLALGHSLELVGADEGPVAIGMDLGASLGWGNAAYNTAYWGATVTTGELNDLVLSIGFPMDIYGVSITPSLNYISLVGDQIQNSNAFDTKHDYFIASVGAAKGF